MDGLPTLHKSIQRMAPGDKAQLVVVATALTAIGPRFPEAETKSAMIRSAIHGVMLVDKGMFGNAYLARMAVDCACLITDERKRDDHDDWLADQCIVLSASEIEKEGILRSMDTLSTRQLQEALAYAAARIVEAEPYLTAADTIIGDGDHGIGMKAGFSALGRLLTENTYETPYELLHACGLCLVRSMGGASGVLFGTLLIGGLESIREAHDLSAAQLVQFFAQSIQAVQKRGRTGPGSKTMVDALLPALDAMEQELENGSGVSTILSRGYQGALAGVENTKAMLPRTGRAKNFREKGIGHPDPGAISVSIFFQGLRDGLK